MGRRADIIQAAKLAAERAKSGGTAVGGAAKRGGEAVGGAAKRGGEAVGGAAKRGGEAAGSAVRRGGDAAGGAVKNAATTVAGKGAALSADLAKAASIGVAQRLDALGNPTLPLESAWGMGFGDFVSGIEGIPKTLRKTVAGRLDKVGSVSLSPAHLEFDGETVEWKDVKTITLGSPTDAMSARAATELVDRLRAVLPKFPGRTFVMRQIAEFVIALCLAGVPKADRPGDDPVQVVTSIKFAGRVRQKELRPGLFAVLLCSMKPEVATAIVETARPFGAVVTIDPARKAAARAVAVRDLVARIRTKIASEPDDE